MRDVRHADGLAHKLAAGGVAAVQEAVAIGVVALLEQLLDGHALPQAIQCQDGLHGGDTPGVLLDERLAVSRLIIHLLAGRCHRRQRFAIF